ncbi:MAG: hypothetical protein EBR82_12155 [Caulobacteraceae bacterium]|nr:hypothetical protein [Caulobacteraceae bacterium]
MKAAVFSSLTSALAFASSVDAALGYPEPGTDIGGGQHADGAQAQSTAYSSVIIHPTKALWAYVADAVTLPIMDAATAATVVDLDSTWWPASQAAGGA